MLEAHPSVRIAWFSPIAPSTSGIAAYSAELVPILASHHTLDVFVDRSPRPGETGVWGAHDFVWKHRRQPYDLTVYQLGNASCHDYMWAYLFRYPGLVVLHDAQLHQARALWLTRRWKPRTDDYLVEFHANHPDAPESIGLLVAAGLGGMLYHHWPHVRLVLESARLTAVHNRRVMLDLSAQYPAAAIEAIEMGVADPRPGAFGAGEVRTRHDIPSDAIVLSAFGAITPEKRIPSVLAAVGAVAGRHPTLHVLLVGSEAKHYDVRADIAARGLQQRVHVAGFVPDPELPAYLEASDICACLRWPTNRETSASWLRCLAAGKPTLVSDLTHLADVPTLDPRDWRVLDARPHGSARRARRTGSEERSSRSSGGGGDAIATEPREPVAVSIDVLDESHSLQLALDRLASERTLRRRLGRAARERWQTYHRLEPMAEAYERLFVRSAALAPPHPLLPAHLVEDGSSKARALATPFGLRDVV